MLGMWLNGLLALAVTVYGVVLFWKAVYHRVLYLRLGRPATASEGERLTGVKNVDPSERQAGKSGRESQSGSDGALNWVSQVFGHRKLLQDWRSGLMHLVVFYGFIVLQLGAIDIVVKGLFGHRLPVPYYAGFLLMQEIAVAAVLLAIGYAGYRRYGERLSRLKRGWKPSLVLFWIGSLMVSVILFSGFDRLTHGEPWAPTSPIASSVASLFAGVSGGAVTALYYIAWWLHLLILLGFLVYVPQSKHFHLLSAPVNLWVKRRQRGGQLEPLDLEDEQAESFGAGKIEDFTRGQLLDLYACVECGRCTNVCPAASTGKLLSPMHLIVKLRDHLTEKGAAITSRSPWMPAFAFGDGIAGSHRFEDVAEERDSTGGLDIRGTVRRQQAGWLRAEGRVASEAALIGDVMTEEEIWACTTCRSCEEHCPVGNGHVDKLVEMRRHLVLMEGSMPADGQRAMQNIERQGNPWGLNRQDRARWMAGLDAEERLPTVKENPGFELLLFVGTMGSYDRRTNKVMKALIRLLNAAGVNAAVLGNEERNSGDTPRRMGNEMLFQQLCQENIETFRRYGVKRIVTACPHTYNVLKHEYPDFGFTAEVLHHTELLAELLRDGKLKPAHRLEERVTYHDSCYLGRYNGTYEAPRRILQAIPGVEMAEMAMNRAHGLCCGAGGGRMWMEDTSGTRVNVARVGQALAVEPTTISSACPYCLTMMEDGTKQLNVDERVRSKDVAELLAESVFGLH
ncbi:heterodisulfide reductase-related iron-sulfur binding cluster [Paenibacillus sp. HJGM_3]|uniref:(Fe-S)-binding protein n=1 Tax=Paenibacillus sp. HJGM_3 TaxID=3379816 RepID=UPI00385C0921